MKLLGTHRSTVPALVQEQDEEPAVARIASKRQSRLSRLPKDSYVALSSNPTELSISMTITKIEHIEALMETLQMYAPQIEYGRRRDED